MSVEALISTQVIDTTTVGRALMTAVDASGARTTLGLGSLATQSGTFSGTSSGTNTGDQTTIVGITGTKAQFNTAVSDGDIVYLDSTDAITGVKTMSGLNVILMSSSGLTIRNPANTFKYTFTGAAILADRVLTLPLTAGTLALTSDITGTNSGTNTGDQTSIVGITGTKAQFDTAVTDGNILYVGDVTTNAAHTGDATGSGALLVVGINNTLLSGLATGILKNTTTTGVPSIAVAGDFPTLNQNTTGSAATLTTARTINGTSFNGSANITVTAAGSTLSDTVTVAKGGTGLTAFGTALQVLRVNAGATALEYAAAGSGSVASDAIWDAAGDLAVGTGADTAARLAKGTSLQVLRVNSGATALEWASPAGGGDALVANPLSQFAATTSAQLAGVISDETGSGALVFGTSPTLGTPVLGTPTSGTLTNCDGTAASLTAGQATAALGIKSATTTVSASAATAPTNGQVLTATSGTTATWQTPSGGGAVAGLETNFLLMGA